MQQPPPSNLEQLCQLDPESFGSNWAQIDALVVQEPESRQVEIWEQVRGRLGEKQSNGHPLFRLGLLKLLIESHERGGIKLLEAAYREDEKFTVGTANLPQRMGAYRLLSLAKEYFAYLREPKRSTWERSLLRPDNRRAIMMTLFMVYDKSLVTVLDTPSFTQRTFSDLIGDRKLLRFAFENYCCADSLIEVWFATGQALNKTRDEYPLARAIVSLLAGVLEAILADRLPQCRGLTLGGLLFEAHKNGLLQIGSRLSTLSSLTLHLRKYIHPERDALRENYFIDINTARGCKAALDWTITELLRQQRPPIAAE